MVLQPLRRWFLSPSFNSKRIGRKIPSPTLFRRPWIESLEDRLTPTLHTWTGSVSNLWSNNGNWIGGAPSTDVFADLVFPTGASNLTNTNDIANLIIGTITYTGSGYTTTGTPVFFNTQGLGQMITTDPTVTGADTFNAAIIFAFGTATVNVANIGAVLTLGGPLSESSTTSLTKTGAGTLLLNGNNTYSGQTTLNNGTLVAGSDTALGSGGVSFSGGTTFQAGGGARLLNNTLFVNGNITISGTNDLKFTGGTTLTAGSFGAPLTLNVTNTGITTFAGNVVTNVSLSPTSVIKAGSGTLDLLGNDTYTVPTIVNGGTLLVDGALPSSGVTVNSGATLGGSGSVQSITATGTVSPGGPGTAILQTGIATFNAGSAFVVKLNGTAAGSSYDQLSVSSATDLSGSPTLVVVPGFSAANGDSFKILASTGPITGTFNGLANNAFLSAGGQIFQISYTFGGVVLTRTTSPTMVALASSANPSVFGQPITFTATVTATNPSIGTPTGTVQFVIDGTNFGSPATLVSGVATSGATSSLSVGSHTVMVVYSGDPNFLGSSATLAQSVLKASTSATVSSSVNPSVFGQPITFTATISTTAPGAGTPSGTVQFQIDGSNAGSPVNVTTTGGVTSATFTTASLTVSSHSITAVYSGDPNFLGSNATLTQTVLKASTSATVSSSVNPSVFGQSTTFTATVSITAPGVGTPTGGVQFQIDGSNAGGPVSVTTTGGVTTASFSTAALGVGSHTVTASYSGDNNFSASNAGSVAQQVNPANTATTLTASASSLSFGQGFIFTAVVRALSPGNGTPTGVVLFQDGSTILGTVSLNSTGTATLATASLAGGPHSVTAIYTRDPNFIGSTSLPVVVRVTSTPNQAFVTALYRTVLERVPDPSGFNFWVQQLQHGASRAIVATAFEISAEHRTLEVNRFYEVIFRRSADVAGRVTWVNALLGGQSEAAVVVAFLISPEYTATHPDNTSYVNGLFQDVLNHAADPAGLAFWVNQLHSGAQSRAQVASAFLGATEAFQQAIDFYYTNFLGRAADQPGTQGFLDALQRGKLSSVDLSTAFLASDEFLNRAIQLGGG